MPRLALVVLTLAACGGRSASTSPAASAAPPTSAFAEEYCSGYAGCADEEVRMDEYEARGDDELSADERAALTDAVAVRVADCRAQVTAMTEAQQDWLSSCTGCGGSCDVYNCIAEAAAHDGAEPFVCDIGGDPDDAIDELDQLEGEGD